MIWEDNGNADREREALVIENKPVGIGCKFSERNGSVVVREILHGGPAQLSSAIAVGDFIEGVNGDPVRDAHEAASRVCGVAGSLVSVTIRKSVECLDVNRVVMLRQQPMGGLLKEEVGVGLTLSVTWDGVLIDSIIPGGPAWLAGKMHPGDVITHIRSVDVRGGTCTPQQVSIMLRSSPGTRLTLKISRGMLRETISVDVVRGHALDLGFVGAYRRALAAKVAVRSGMLDESIGGASSITHTHTSAPGSPLRTAARPSSKMSWGSVITGVGTTRGGIGGGWDPQALYGYGIRHGTLVNGGCVEVKDKDGMNGVSRSEIREVQICKGAANRTTSRREELMIQADQVQMEILTLERRLDQSFEALTRRVNAMESGPSTMEL